jgi:hypothetical protein
MLDAVLAKQEITARAEDGERDTLFGQQQLLLFKEKEEWLFRCCCC